MLYFITSLIQKLPLFQFSFKMAKQIIVKFFQESEFAKELTQATQGSAGYNLKLFLLTSGGLFQKTFMEKFIHVKVW